MGCWHKTCGLSNLHITHGTEAYVFVLEPANADEHCYATHLYKPLLLPFVTEYNDYGGGENSSGVTFPIVMNAIKECLHEMDVGENEYHDIAVKKDKFDEALFFEAVHEGRLFKANRYTPESPTKIQYVMFRKDIVDDILANYTIEKYVGDGKGTGGWGNNYVYYKFADIVADILPLLQEIMDMVIQAKATEQDIAFKLLGGFEYMFDYNHPNLAANWMRMDSYRYSRIVDLRHVFFDLFGKDDVPTEEQVLELEAVLTEHIRGIFIDAFMEHTRKSWIPAGHEGSQTQDAEPYRVLMAATTRALDAEEKRWAEENGEDEE
jgi:hypothetical protein